MVRLALDAMRADAENFDVHHVNARFSETLDEIGESSFLKGFLITKFCFRHLDPVETAQACPLLCPWTSEVERGDPRLVYTGARPVFPKVIFHWHAIGQGEWSSGSERVSLPGPEWLDRIARRLSGFFFRNLTPPSQSLSNLRPMCMPLAPNIH